MTPAWGPLGAAPKPWLAEWGCVVHYSPSLTRQGHFPFCLKSFYWGRWSGLQMAIISINVTWKCTNTANGISRDTIPSATCLSCFHCLDKISRRLSLTLSCWLMPDPRSIQHCSGFCLGHRLKPEVMNTDWIQSARVMSQLLHLLAVWLWENYLTSLWLGFFLFNWGLANSIVVRITWVHICEKLRPVLATWRATYKHCSCLFAGHDLKYGLCI